MTNESELTAEDIDQMTTAIEEFRAGKSQDVEDIIRDLKRNDTLPKRGLSDRR